MQDAMLEEIGEEMEEEDIIIKQYKYNLYYIFILCRFSLKHLLVKQSH